MRESEELEQARGAAEKKGWLIIGTYALLALTVWPVYPHFISPNESSRWILAASVFEHRSIEVSRLVPFLGGRMEDLSLSGDRVYSNKSPGGAFLGLPGYALGRLFAGPPSSGSMRVTITTMRIVTSTLPLLALAAAVLALGRRYGRSERVPLLLLVLLFGTPLCAYGMLLFSHAIVAAALFAAWLLLFILEEKPVYQTMAGVLIGLAVVSEYSSAVPGAALIIGSLFRNRSAVRWVVAGGIPFALGLGLYNQLAFGGPFELSSGHERFDEFRSLASSGLFGIRFPSPKTLLSLLIDPSRGLLIFSPVIVVALRLVPETKRRLEAPAFWTLIATPLSLFLLIGGYPNWHGGWTVGARYLVGSVPFLLFPLLFSRGGRIDALLAGASVAAIVPSTLLFPFIPNAFPFPWGSFSLPLLARGLISPNLFHLITPPLAVAVPLLIAATAIVLASNRREYLAVLAGILIWTAVPLGLRMLSPEGPGLILQRAYVADVYFEQKGSLETALPPGLPLPPRLLQRKEMEMALPPSSWPFHVADAPLSRVEQAP